MKKMIHLFKTVRAYVALALFVLTFGSCNSPKLPALPEGFKYTITEDKLDQGLSRRTVRVKINQEIKEPVVRDLSDWIHDNRTDFKSMIIFYYREDASYTGAWMRVDYNPEYKTELIALSSHDQI